jgi:hypothetical protein
MQAPQPQPSYVTGKAVVSGSGLQLLINDEVTWERGADPGIPFGTVGRISKFLKVPFRWTVSETVNDAAYLSVRAS